MLTMTKPCGRLGQQQFPHLQSCQVPGCQQFEQHLRLPADTWGGAPS